MPKIFKLSCIFISSKNKLIFKIEWPKLIIKVLIANQIQNLVPNTKTLLREIEREKRTRASLLFDLKIGANNNEKLNNCVTF